jgi:hypothetical protein
VNALRVADRTRVPTRRDRRQPDTAGRPRQRYRLFVQNPGSGIRPGAPGRSLGGRISAVAAVVVAWLVSSVVVAGPSLAASIDSTNVDGSQHANKWPLIQTLGVFVGIPLGSAILIVVLVMLGPIIRSGRAGADEDAVFAGPHAGSVDARVDPGTVGPSTHTGEPDGPAAGSLDQPGVGPEPAGATRTTTQGGAGASW